MGRRGRLPAHRWSPAAFAHPAIGNVKGANERLNVAILGPGGRAQEHIKHLSRLKESKNVQVIGLADVWDGNKEVGRGLYPSAEKCGVKVDDKEKVTKDYRKLLDCKDVDICPDRHARPLAREDDD